MKEVIKKESVKTFNFDPFIKSTKHQPIANYGWKKCVNVYT